MIRHELRLLTFLIAGLIVMFSIAGPAQAKGGEALCAPFAAALRAGKAMGTNPIYDGLPRLLSPGRPTETVVYTTSLLNTLRPTEALRKQLGRMLGEPGLGNNPSIVWLRPSRVGAVKLEGGHMDCVRLLFFQMRAGRADTMQQPLSISSTDMFCAGDAPAFVTAGKTPAIILSGKGEQMLRIVPLHQSDWGPGCEVDGSFQDDVSAPAVSCRKGADCSGIAQAAELKLRAKVNSPSTVQGNIENLPNGLRDLARNTAGLLGDHSFDGLSCGEFETFGKAEYLDIFPLSVGTKMYVAVLGFPDIQGDRTMCVWEPGGKMLNVIAGVTFDWKRGEVISLRVKRL